MISNNTREMCLLYLKPEAFAIPVSRRRKPERPQPEITIQQKREKDKEKVMSKNKQEGESDSYTRKLGPEKNTAGNDGPAETPKGQ